MLTLIQTHAGLRNTNFLFGDNTTQVCIETLKSICNLAYNSKHVAEMCCRNGILDGVLKRIAKHEYVKRASYYSVLINFW